MKRRGQIGSGALLLAVAATGVALFAWKRSALSAEQRAAAAQPEPMEAVQVGVAGEREHRRTTTSIGTVREVRLVPGENVEAGTLLVALDVSVEEAELAA